MRHYAHVLQTDLTIWISYLLTVTLLCIPGISLSYPPATMADYDHEIPINIIIWASGPFVVTLLCLGYSLSISLQAWVAVTVLYNS